LACCFSPSPSIIQKELKTVKQVFKNRLTGREKIDMMRNVPDWAFMPADIDFL